MSHNGIRIAEHPRRLGTGAVAALGVVFVAVPDLAHANHSGGVGGGLNGLAILVGLCVVLLVITVPIALLVGRSRNRPASVPPGPAQPAPAWPSPSRAPAQRDEAAVTVTAVERGEPGTARIRLRIDMPAFAADSRSRRAMADYYVARLGSLVGLGPKKPWGKDGISVESTGADVVLLLVGLSPANEVQLEHLAKLTVYETNMDLAPDGGLGRMIRGVQDSSVGPLNGP